MSALLDSFRDGYAALRDPDALQSGDGRRQALAALLADGLPGPREEAWKYTPLRALERRAFAAADPAPPACDPALLADIPAPRLVFVNGRYDDGASDLAGLPPGVDVQALSRLLASGQPREANFLLRQYARRDEAFARVNAALAEEGAVVRVAEGVRAPLPLHLVSVAVPQHGDRAWHLRHLVQLRNDAALDIVEHRLAGGDHAHLATEVLQLHAGQRVQVRHARIQDDAAGATCLARTDAVLAAVAPAEGPDVPHAEALQIALATLGPLQTTVLSALAHAGPARRWSTPPRPIPVAAGGAGAGGVVAVPMRVLTPAGMFAPVFAGLAAIAGRVAPCPEVLRRAGRSGVSYRRSAREQLADRGCLSGGQEGPIGWTGRLYRRDRAGLSAGQWSPISETGGACPLDRAVLYEI